LVQTFPSYLRKYDAYVLCWNKILLIQLKLLILSHFTSSIIHFSIVKIAKCSELKAQHDEEVAQLRLEWTEEREAMERDTQELRESFNARVEAKVEVLKAVYCVRHTR